MFEDNSPAVIPAAMQNLVMTPPAELMQALAGNFADAYSDFGSQFRSISLKGFQFTLRESGSSTVWPHPTLPCVILAMGPDNHCTWFANSYTGEEGTQPTAVWYQKQGAPANVPASVLAKDANGRNQYKISRRIVLALLRQNPNTGEMFIDLDAPYVLDAGSMSIFGNDMPDQMAFSLSGLVRYCYRNKLLPLHFITQIIFDRSASVPSVRFVPSNQNGQVLFLDKTNLERVYAAAASPEIAQMVKINQTKVEPEPEVAPQAAPVAPQAAPVAPNMPPAPEAPVEDLPPQMQAAAAAPAPAAPSEDVMAQAANAAKAAEATVQANQSAGSDAIQNELDSLLQAAGAYGE